MGIFSSGNKFKYAAQSALNSAAALKDQQSDIDFRRGLLSNIRQERIARAMIEQGEYSDDISTSSAAGALANIDSSLAGETHYAYDTSLRAQKIQDLNLQADELYKKYQKQQKRRGQAIQIAAIAAGALTGGALAGAGAFVSGAITGASVGQSIGNIATGNTQEGIQGLINTGAMSYNMNVNAKLNAEALDRIKSLGATHVAESLDETGKVIPGSREYIYTNPYLRYDTVMSQVGTPYKAVKGCFNG